jgi:hypothetical protein
MRLTLPLCARASGVVSKAQAATAAQAKEISGRDISVSSVYQQAIEWKSSQEFSNGGVDL